MLIVYVSDYNIRESLAYVENFTIFVDYIALFGHNYCQCKFCSSFCASRYTRSIWRDLRGRSKFEASPSLGKCSPNSETLRVYINFAPLSNGIYSFSVAIALHGKPDRPNW